MTLLTDAISLLHSEQPIREPVFIKEDSTAQQQLAGFRIFYAEAKAAGAPADLLASIERDGKLIKYGMAGEESLAFELRNSHLPLIVIHDLYLQHGDLSAQIDYLIISRRFSLVLECKNLYGDITINDKGDFIRGMQYAGRFHKEGIYSPVTQLQRHMDLLKQMGTTEANGGAIGRATFKHYFEDNYKPLVVLANPKTVLHDKYAPKDVKAQVIRADRLIETIKRLEDESKNALLTDRDMRRWAERWLNRGSECPADYLAKYKARLDGCKHAE